MVKYRKFICNIHEFIYFVSAIQIGINGNDEVTTSLMEI